MYAPWASEDMTTAKFKADNGIVDMQTELYQLTGIHFDIEEQEIKVSHERMGGDTSDSAKAFYSGGTDTHFYANGFSFDYKGAKISGRLPRTYAGFASRLDSELVDLIPAVEKVCGFKLDMSQVGGW